MIVLDANVLIAHLDERDAHHELARERLMEVADRQFAVSPITLAEVLVGPTRASRLSAVHAVLRRLDIVEVPLPVNAAERLAELRVDTALKLPDCCVLLAAESVRGGVLTFDDALSREADRLGLGFPA